MNRIVRFQGSPAVLLLVVHLAASALAGCSVSVDPGPCRSADCQPVSYRFSLARYTSRQADTTYHALQGEARFEPYQEDLGTLGSAEAGEVTLNGTRLRQVRVLAPRQVFYTLNASGDGATAAPPGEANLWRATGSGEVAPMELSIVSPRAPLALLSPSPNDTIAADMELSLRWTTPDPADRPRTTDKIFVTIEGAGEQVSPGRSLQVADTGRLTLPLDSLRSWGLRSGPLSISILRTMADTGIAPDGRLYVLSIAESEGALFFLNY